MTDKFPQLRNPDFIGGEDYQIMVRVSQYVAGHEPINEYFDPVATLNTFEKEGENLLTPEERAYFQKIYPEYVMRQKEAFSEAFNIIQDFLSANPDIPLEILDKAYTEMAKLYGFNYSLNQAYLKFRNYFIESRKYLKELEERYPNKIDLFKYLTGIEKVSESDIQIKRGPIAFEIRVTQSILSKFNKKSNESLLERVKDKILPSHRLLGISSQKIELNSGIKGNFIVYPMEDKVSDFFLVFDSYINSIVTQGFRKTKSGEPIRFIYSHDSIRKHENQHALYNIIMEAENASNPKSIIEEVRGILLTEDPNKVDEQNFSLFCDFITQNAFFYSAANEILATIKGGSFLTSVKTINNPKVYNFINPYDNKFERISNIYLQDIINRFLGGKDNINSDKFNKIYQSYTEQAQNYISSVSQEISEFLEKFPDKNDKLVNILMFAPFANWKDEIARYSHYLQNKN